jgi:ABC-2 type transport system ATP-binding protein
MIRCAVSILRVADAPAIAVHDLHVTRGDAPVLRGISVEVPAGAVTGLLGPSGCGKSTLMRAIVGVQIVASGTIEVLGEPAGSPSLRTRLGYVTQAPSVYGDLSVRENLVYFRRVLGAASERVDAVIASVGLERFADRVVDRLSGGQRARVSLATALLNEPDVLVLDEPTVGLDPVLRRSLWTIFHDLAAAGTSLLVSSHVMDEAGNCDRLLLMREGEILAAATPAQLREETGEQDLGEAFLRTIERSEAAR